MSGYYEMYVPPWILNVRVTASNHAPFFGQINVTGVSDYAFDALLDRDLYEPNMTYNQSPRENISWSNPSFTQVTIQEENLREMTLLRFMEWNSTGLDSNWTMIDWKRTTFDPWNPESGLPFSIEDGNYSVTDIWDGTVQGGWLSDGIDSAYLPASMWPWYMEPIYAVSGFHTNATSPRTQGSALFNASTGAFMAFMPMNMGGPSVVAPDPTGVFEPQCLVIEYNDGWIVDFNWRSLGVWDLDGLTFTYDDVPPSGNYKSEFYANDWGNSGNWSLVDNTVDHESPTADAGPDQNVPSNSVVTLDGRASYDNVGVASYLWEFFNATGVWTVLWGDVVTCSFETPGTYEINLTIWDGANHAATDSITVDVFLDLPPVADAGPDQSVADDTEVYFDGSGSSDDYGIFTYSWFISELSAAMFGVAPQYTFWDPGVYHVSLVVTDSVGQNSAPDEMVVTVTDVTPPIADAGLDQYVTNGTKVTFDGSWSWDDVGIVDYVWSFFDVMPVELHGATANYTFSAPGTYLVILTVYDAEGNYGSDDLSVTVDGMPMADAGPDQTVDEDTWVTFDGSGSWDDIGIVEYTWFISELSVWMFGPDPQYWLPEPGTYHVTLVVADTIWQYSDPDEMVVTVKDVTPPTADAGSDQLVLAGTLVTMNGSGSTDNVGVVNYVWSFFDVMPVELYGMEVSYVFTADGSYLVTLNVSDAGGNWAIDTLSIDVFSDARPVADAGPDQTVDEDSLVTFDGSGSSDDNGVDNYTWTIAGLSVIMYEVSPTYTFDDPGVYHVWLVVYDSVGQASDPDEMIVTVNDLTPPTAEAGLDQLVNNGTMVTLDGSASIDNGPTVNYTWSFTDGVYTELYGITATYTFSAPGLYWVDLRIEDSGGNSAWDGLWVTVNGPPIAGTMGDQWISPGDEAYFGGWWCWDDLDWYFDLEYTWTFTYAGAEVVLQDKNPDMYYEFMIAGEYTVNLMVKDTGGLTDNASMRIYVASYMSAWWVDPRTNENLVDGATIALDYAVLRGYVDSWEEVRVITPTGLYTVWADDDGLFEVNPLNLSAGLNIVTISSYSDWWGDTISWFKMIQSDTYCRLWVDSPTSPTSDLTAAISGWTDPDAGVTVNGVPVAVLPDGTFSAVISLSEGANDINVTATDSVGNMNWAELVIWRDTMPPALTIEGPITGSIVDEPNVVVFGTVEAGASVMVNGVLAAPGTSWSVTVSLVEGANTVVVTATDSIGNSVSQVLVVNYVPPEYVTPEELAELRAEMLAEIGNLSAAMQENVTLLQDQIDAAMDEIAALQSSLLENITALQGEIDLAMDDILALQASLAENITALQAQIAAAMDEIAALQASIGENVTALQGQIDAAMADIVGLQASLLENVTALQSDIASAMADIVSLEAALTDNVTALQDQINDAVLDISGLQAALAENVTALESEISILEGALQENVTALEQAIAQNNTAQQQALAQNITALQSQIAALRAELQANVTSLTGALTENVTALQGLVDALDQNLADVQAELAGVNATLVAAQDDIDAALDAIDANMTDLQNQIDEIEQATQDVEETAGDTDSFASMLMYLTLILFAIAMVMIVLVWYMANKKFGKGGAGKPEESLEEVEGPTEVEKEFESLEKEIKDEEL
jgi:PKD repeat protein/predicted  nucleic acid-binding Zn-ribbon protein